MSAPTRRTELLRRLASSPRTFQRRSASAVVFAGAAAGRPLTAGIAETSPAVDVIAFSVKAGGSQDAHVAAGAIRAAT